VTRESSADDLEVPSDHLRAAVGARGDVERAARAALRRHDRGEPAEVPEIERRRRSRARRGAARRCRSGSRPEAASAERSVRSTGMSKPMPFGSSSTTPRSCASRRSGSVSTALISAISTRHPWPPPTRTCGQPRVERAARRGRGTAARAAGRAARPRCRTPARTPAPTAWRAAPGRRRCGHRSAGWAGPPRARDSWSSTVTRMARWMFQSPAGKLDEAEVRIAELDMSERTIGPVAGERVLGEREAGGGRGEDGVAPASSRITTLRADAQRTTPPRSFQAERLGGQVQRLQQLVAQRPLPGGLRDVEVAEAGRERAGRRADPMNRAAARRPPIQVGIRTRSPRRSGSGSGPRSCGGSRRGRERPVRKVASTSDRRLFVLVDQK
jgi:hypothetical protein